MKKTIAFAFQQTIPVLCGYLFLGLAFGLLLQHAGYGPLWAFFISLIVYAGSMQFVLVELLTSGAGLLTAALTTLSVNSRHFFYGLSFIEKFKSMGARYPYMVFSLTDETYSLLCSVKVPPELRESDVFFTIALLDHSYWIAGSVLGAVAGGLITFSTAGVDFAMTALFVVIFIEQWLACKRHEAALVGLGCAILSLFVFGPEDFLLPALIAAVGLLIALRRILETPAGKEEAQS